ncbi:hypothetical protein ACS0TY_027580 [Phlomoides rotata]
MGSSRSRGFFVAVFSKPVGWGLLVEAEIDVGLLAIRYAYHHGWTNLWLESDSILAVRALQNFQPSVSW